MYYIGILQIHKVRILKILPLFINIFPPINISFTEGKRKYNLIGLMHKGKLLYSSNKCHILNILFINN